MNLRFVSRRDGFTLLEVLVALLITSIVMAAVYELLTLGQRTQAQIEDTAALEANGRAALHRIVSDVAMAGYLMPPQAALLWEDGGGPGAPDSLTVLYGDPSGADTVVPSTTNGSLQALSELELGEGAASWPVSLLAGMHLIAIELEDCNEDGAVGLATLRLTDSPRCADARCESIVVPFVSDPAAGATLPAGFRSEVRAECAVFGRVRIVQYRISPDSSIAHPELERRELPEHPEWVAVAEDIEDLQVQFVVGTELELVDAPLVPPRPDDAETWIRGASIRLTSRSHRPRLVGSTASLGGGEPYLRRTFSTAMSLRNLPGAQTGGSP